VIWKKRPFFHPDCVSCVVHLTEISRLIKLSLATFFRGLLQLTDGPSYGSILNMRRTSHSSSHDYPEWAVGGKKRPVCLADLKSPRESQWMVALSDERKKKFGEKKIATLFPPVGANRARLRHAGRSLRARGCSLFILSTGILVPERLSSLSDDDGGATTEGRDGSSLFLGHREKL